MVAGGGRQAGSATAGRETGRAQASRRCGRRLRTSACCAGAHAVRRQQRQVRKGGVSSRACADSVQVSSLLSVCLSFWNPRQHGATLGASPDATSQACAARVPTVPTAHTGCNGAARTGQSRPRPKPDVISGGYFWGRTCDDVLQTAAGGAVATDGQGSASRYPSKAHGSIILQHQAGDSASAASQGWLPLGNAMVGRSRKSSPPWDKANGRRTRAVRVRL